ncbi:hypothetical protein Tco_0874815 [Tanacetum coccineum]|uniref:Integrase zinc-binding domain-containing protein n=1 Tax=Tanacetum coccineum TaxID=301880 RepID=A0ABQ5BRW7_9ASTR
MRQEQVQQAARDEKFVSTRDRVKIGKSNLRIDPTITQKEETYQVILDIIKNTTYYNAFLITANVLKIYMQQFWFTIKKVKKSSFYQFDIDNKMCQIGRINPDLKKLKHKEAEDLAADHLSRFENSHMEVLTEREIADKFFDEHLMVLKSKFSNDEPCASVTAKKVYESRFYWPSVFKDANEYLVLPEHPSDTYVFTMKMEILLEPTSNKLMVGRSSQDLEVQVKMEMEIPRSSGVNFITACSYSTDTSKDLMKAQVYVSKLPQL